MQLENKDDTFARANSSIGHDDESCGPLGCEAFEKVAHTERDASQGHHAALSPLQVNADRRSGAHKANE